MHSNILTRQNPICGPRWDTHSVVMSTCDVQDCFHGCAARRACLKYGCSAAPFRKILADESDDDDGAKNSSGLPKLQEGTEFVVLTDPDETWKKTWDGVKASLVQSGHKSATTIRSIDRVRVRPSNQSWFRSAHGDISCCHDV